MHYKKHAGRSQSGKAQRFADGGAVQMARPGMAPTDPTITAADVKTWGTPDNARAAARAREAAEKRGPVSREDHHRAMNEMGRNSGGRV